MVLSTGNANTIEHLKREIHSIKSGETDPPQGSVELYDSFFGIGEENELLLPLLPVDAGDQGGIDLSDDFQSMQFNTGGTSVNREIVFSPLINMNPKSGLEFFITEISFEIESINDTIFSLTLREVGETDNNELFIDTNNINTIGEKTFSVDVAVTLDIVYFSWSVEGIVDLRYPGVILKGYWREQNG